MSSMVIMLSGLGWCERAVQAVVSCSARVVQLVAFNFGYSAYIIPRLSNPGQLGCGKAQTRVLR